MDNEISSAPNDRFCDLVMDGGITSGVVYPRAITHLARNYRFKNIGGTSAGAIAAAVTAAAEYQRRNTDSMAGFNLLEKLPERLGGRKAGSDKTYLFNLFQPHPSTKRIFKVLYWALNRTTWQRRVAATGWGLMQAYWPAFLGSTGVAFLVWSIPPLFLSLGDDGKTLLGVTAVFTWLILTLLLTTVWVYLDFTRNVVKNDYGLCTGMGVNAEGQEALTPWLHRLIQQAAKLPIDKNPLTFGDLWDAKGYPPDWLKDDSKGEVNKSINLQLFTTNLSHGRPYILPFEDEDSRLFYKKSELEKYLPSSVMEFINKSPKKYLPRDGSNDPDSDAAEELFELPDPKKFPVVLAVRMSLSFPLLFSAIPLWAIDYDKQDGKEKKGTFQRCLFSDGGISSNFPIHLFDGLIPLWPTFGIALESKLPEQKELVYLPKNYQDGYHERWNRFDQESASGDRFWKFIWTIVSTMQNWSDSALSRMPGVRDRVIRVRLEDKEGGMNLNMNPDLIKKLGDCGDTAAAELIERFCVEGSSGSAKGWDEQRWIRLNVLLCMLEKQLPWIVAATRNGTPHTQDFNIMVNEAKRITAAGCDQFLDDEAEITLNRLIQDLTNFAAQFGARLDTFKPVPGPKLRVRPPM